jgi:ATP-dependent DNA ligase
MLPFDPPLEPMLAKAADSIPQGENLVYEPKWDGFRCIVFFDGTKVTLSSRSGKPLERYFPELMAPLSASVPMVIDGEIVLPSARGLDFETLQMRLHPAASRIEKLSQAFPTAFIAFDLLALQDSDLRGLPFAQRRKQLVDVVRPTERLRITPQTADRATAEQWFVDLEGAGCDGVMTRDVTLPYLAGERVMTKTKHHRTADCVIAAFRTVGDKPQVASLLLGLYDEHGVLHYVGHTASFNAAQKRALYQQLDAMRGDSPFTVGRAPQEQSRWTKGVAQTPHWVKPTLVCEVSYDFLSGPRFRHASTFLRFREDKVPAQCTFEQLLPVRPFSLDNVWDSGGPGEHRR